MGKFFFIYFIFALLGNPFVALLVVVVLFLALDRRYMRLFPKLVQQIKNRQRLRQLLQDVAANPHNVTGKLDIGRLYADRKQYEAAIPYLKEALSEMPDHTDGLFSLGLSYLHTGHENLGIDTIEKALKIHPRVRYGEPYLQLADYYKQRGDYGEALHSLARSDQAGLSSAEKEYRRGQIQQKRGDEEAAKEAYHAAIHYYHTSPKFLKKESRWWAFLSRLALLRRSSVHQ